MFIINILVKVKSIYLPSLISKYYNSFYIKILKKLEFS